MRTFLKIKLSVKINNIESSSPNNISVVVAQATETIYFLNGNILFTFFINEILENTSVGNDHIVSIDDIKLFMLLYADDAVLVRDNCACSRSGALFLPYRIQPHL